MSTTNNAIISVYFKEGLDDLVAHLIRNNYRIYSTGGTYRKIQSILNEMSYPSEKIHNCLVKISDLTKFPEILDGRVKTLHPMIYAGLLARQDKPDHLEQLVQHHAPQFNLVVVNLYPFDQVSDVNHQLAESQELIDIGGVTLLRAAAKNCQTISVLSDSRQYRSFCHRLILKTNDLEYRLGLARQAFETTSRYDQMIQQRLEAELTQNHRKRKYQEVMPLKYGCNPHQSEAHLYTIGDDPKASPITVLNGRPGYINILDALNGWSLVSSARDELNTTVVASFKHTSPAGVGQGGRLISKPILEAYGLRQQPGSSLARAYLRARNSDPMSSFGDFVALSHPCDLDTASLIKAEVSDGIIAPGYEPEALDVLRKKKGGNYLILQVDGQYRNHETIEYRELGGLALSQSVNKRVITRRDLPIDLPEKITEDIILANITLMYAQSNNVVLAYDGQVVGIAAGQQSRVDCVKLAGRKFTTWYMRQHPKVKLLQTLFRKDKPIKRSERVNATIRYIEGDFTNHEFAKWSENFPTDKTPDLLTDQERQSFMAEIDQRLEGIVMCSDAFFPFRDNIDHAEKYGVEYVVHPGGSRADPEIAKACADYGMTLITTGVRQFTH